jgi:hypothetical protein
MNKAIFSLMAALVTLGFVSCNNSGSSASSTDSSTTNTATTTATSSGNYAARADSIRINSEAGNYLNPRTGKPVKLSMNTTSGAVTDESGRPVKRYVDKRSWWVYDVASGDTVGSANMNNGSLMYRGSNGDWETYDKRWTDDTTSMNDNSSMNNSDKMNSGSMTDSMGGHKKLKIKSTDKGVKVKPKD